MAMREEKHVSLQWPCLASLFWLRNIHLDSMSHWEHHSIMRSETGFSQASRGHLKQCEQTYNKHLKLTVIASFGYDENFSCCVTWLLIGCLFVCLCICLLILSIKIVNNSKQESTILSARASMSTYTVYILKEIFKTTVHDISMTYSNLIAVGFTGVTE